MTCFQQDLRYFWNGSFIPLFQDNLLLLSSRVNLKSFWEMASQNNNIADNNNNIFCGNFSPAEVIKASILTEAWEHLSCALTDWLQQTLPPSICVHNFEHDLLQGDRINNSFKQSYSCEMHISSTSQEIPLLLWNSKVHFLNHKSLPLFPVMSRWIFV